jgi:hypothetical protein
MNINQVTYTARSVAEAYSETALFSVAYFRRFHPESKVSFPDVFGLGWCPCEFQRCRHLCSVEVPDRCIVPVRVYHVILFISVSSCL